MCRKPAHSSRIIDDSWEIVGLSSRFATPSTVVMDPRRALQEACAKRGIFDQTEYRVVYEDASRGGGGGRVRKPSGIAVFLAGRCARPSQHLRPPAPFYLLG